MSQGPVLRKYGVQTTINFVLFEVDGVDFRADAADSGANCTIMKDEGAEATCTNDFTDEGTGYSLVLDSTEMSAARIVVYVIDAATKIWLDTSIIVETYGHASAMHAMDFDEADGSQFTEAGGDGDHLVEAGGDGDHLTAINLPNQTMDITGSLSGSVGSVTGAVGSVAGNVDGSVASVTAEVTADITKISGSATAANKLEEGAEALAIGTVNDASASTTVFKIALTGDTVDITDDHYNGRVITFTSGALLQQSTDITDYDGGTTTVTVTALTEAPANGVQFVIS